MSKIIPALLTTLVIIFSIAILVLGYKLYGANEIVRLSAAASSTAPANQQPMNEERLREAQIRYLEQGAKKTGNDPPNATSVFTLVGVLITAIVALVSLYINSRNSSRSQRDTQFYEALRRFGDRDSVIVRFSAAGLIGEMGSRKAGYFKSVISHFLHRSWQPPYFETAVDQLVGGIQLETDSAVLNAIASAIRHLTSNGPSAVLKKVYDTNLTLEERLIIHLAKYLQGLRRSSDGQDLTKSAIDDRFWMEAIVVTRLPYDQLEIWRNAYNATFYRTLLSAEHRLRDISTAQLREYMKSEEELLQTAGERLRLNDAVFVYIYYGMFLDDHGRAGHKTKMDKDLRHFFSQRALRQGAKSVPDHWLDLAHGRPKVGRLIESRKQS